MNKNISFNRCKCNFHKRCNWLVKKNKLKN